MKAAAGELVTCEMGHPMYRMALDVIPNETPLRATLFEPVNDQIPRLQRGTPVTLSAHCSCGARWVRPDPPYSIAFHFHDGWRSLVS